MANQGTRGVLPGARGVERSAQRANEVKISPAGNGSNISASTNVYQMQFERRCLRSSGLQGVTAARVAPQPSMPNSPGTWVQAFLALCSRNAARAAQAPERQYGHEQHSCRHHPCAAPGRLRTRGPLCGLRSLGHGAPRKARASGTWVLPLRGDGVPLPALRQHDEHAPGPPARADARSTDGRVDWTGLALSPARVTREDEVRCGFRRWATLG